MAGNKTNYLSDAMIRHQLNIEPMQPQGILYVALFTSVPDLGTGTAAEVDGLGYERAVLINQESTWEQGTGPDGYPIPGYYKNRDYIIFRAAREDWGLVLAVGLYDAPVGGNLLYANTVDPAQAIYKDNSIVVTIGGISFIES